MHKKFLRSSITFRTICWALLYYLTQTPATAGWEHRNNDAFGRETWTYTPEWRGGSAYRSSTGYGTSGGHYTTPEPEEECCDKPCVQYACLPAAFAWYLVVGRCCEDEAEYNSCTVYCPPYRNNICPKQRLVPEGLLDLVCWVGTAPVWIPFRILAHCASGCTSSPEESSEAPST